jgi:hypothetical protein
MTEQEMRDSKVPTVEDDEELKKYIHDLINQEHDYGTCVYAMSMAATAAFNYVASKLGVTGFQTSCAGMDILRRTRRLKSGFMILDYENLLFPQYCNSEHFPGWTELISKNREMLSQKAKELLRNSSNNTHPDVKAHWIKLSKLTDSTDCRG